MLNTIFYITKEYLLIHLWLISYFLLCVTMYFFLILQVTSGVMFSVIFPFFIVSANQARVNETYSIWMQ